MNHISKRIAMLCLIGAILSSDLWAQRFESSPFIEVSGGVGIPLVSGTLSFGTGPKVSGSLGVPLAGTVLTSLKVAAVFPRLDLADANATITSVSLDLAFPFAPEAGSTMYVDGALGMIRQQISTPLVSATSDWKAGFEAGFGFLFAPEHWANIYMNFRAGYSTVFENSGWQDITVSAGIGLHLF